MSLPSESLAVLSNASLSNASRSNAALVNRYRQRDESAFTEIFERHRHLVYRVCLRYVGHHHDAEDITQETFRRAALAMPGVDSQRPLEPWLVTIAANRCRSFLSRKQRDRHANSLDEVSSPSGAEHDSARRLSLSEQLDCALDRLPVDQRRAFELVHQKELSYPEAARVMGRPLGTVKTWVRRAKRDMQVTLRAADSADTSKTGLASATSLASDANLASGTNLASVTGAETASAAAHARRAGTRKSAAALLTSVVLLGYLGLLRRNAPKVAPNPGKMAVASIDTPSNFAVGLPAVGALDRGSDAANRDWQWVSLTAFLRAGMSVDIHALPLGQWMQQTSPALDHLRSGIRPLGSTLHRVAELFQCEIAHVGPPSTSSLGRPKLHVPGDESSMNEAAGFDEFGSTTDTVRSLRSSIS